MNNLNYTIIITSPAYGAQSSYCAYQFCHALTLNKKLKLNSIFFYADGVLNANAYGDPANDETNLTKLWQELAQKNAIKLLLCSSASQRRGVINKNMASYFELASLIDLSYEISKSARVIQF